MTESHDRLVGNLVLGRYRILRLLARGGMGAVYLGRVEGAAGFAKPVVVKRILPHLSSVTDKKAQFVREAQILSHLRHPGIVNVLDFGKLDDAYVMVLEYVHGYNLFQWLKYCILVERAVPWEVAVYVVLQVLAALNGAHTYTRSDGLRAEIIHRDISLSNILLDVDGSVRLADFGIARMEMEQSLQERSSEGIFKGKLPYAAPELFAGAKATPSSDVYACGVVLYQVISGTNPFTAQDVSAIVQRVISLVPEPVSSFRSDLPPELDAVLAKVLAKEANRRYSNAAEFAAALRSLLRHSEAQIAAEMTALVREDFMGDMARMLELQSLDELEEAWRNANANSNIPSRSSMPATIEVRVTAGGLQAAEMAITPVSTSVVTETGHSNRRLVITIVAAALVATASVITAALLMRQPAEAQQPRFVVVESPNDRTAAQPNPTQREVSSVGPTDAKDSPTPRASASARATRSDPLARDSSNGLSRAFGRRQGAIQNCFQTHASDMSGAPELSIRFETDAQGRVSSATVRPAAVATTALGQCLHGVARSTDFGPQERPLAFSIPITAHAR